MPSTEFKNNINKEIIRLSKINPETSKNDFETTTSLDDNSKLNTEFMRLNEEFIYGNGMKTFPLDKFNSFKMLFSDLRGALDGYLVRDINDQKEVETFKKIMVYLSLELGTEVSFPNLFTTMLENGELSQDYYDMKESFSYPVLYQKYGGVLTNERNIQRK